MSKPFGKSLLIDLYDCAPGVADDLELTYRFLEELVQRLGMTQAGSVYLIHGPRDKNGKELFPDKAGVSGFVPLIESGISIHSVEPTHFVTIDIYTCGELSIEPVLEYIQDTFKPNKIETNALDRGVSYHKNTVVRVYKDGKRL